jgi:hypothetical protein
MVITVHYDPNDPEDVRLSTGWDGQDNLTIGLLIFSCGLFGFTAVRSRRRGRKPAAAGAR